MDSSLQQALRDFEQSFVDKLKLKTSYCCSFLLVNNEDQMYVLEFWNYGFVIECVYIHLQGRSCEMNLGSETGSYL